MEMEIEKEKTTKRFNIGFNTQIIDNARDTVVLDDNNGAYKSVILDKQLISYNSMHDLNAFVDIPIMEHIIRSSIILDTVYGECWHSDILELLAYIIHMKTNTLNDKCLLIDSSLLLKFYHMINNTHTVKTGYIDYVGLFIGIPVYSVPYSLNLKSNTFISIIKKDSITLYESNHRRASEYHNHVAFAVRDTYGMFHENIIIPIQLNVM